MRRLLGALFVTYGAATVMLLPIVILYTSWVYRVMRGRVTLKQVRNGHGGY